MKWPDRLEKKLREWNLPNLHTNNSNLNIYEINCKITWIISCWHEFYAIQGKPAYMFSMSTRFHAVLDYSFSLFLMLSPVLFGFGEADSETIVPIVSGMTICFYSFFTKYEASLSPLISLKTHYLLDIGIGLGVAFSPWIFGFRDSVYKPHLVTGLAFAIVGIIGIFPMVKLQKPSLHRVLGDLARFIEKPV